MYNLLPELAGDTPVFVGDDSIANVIAGILYPNPPGTKMHAVGEAYRSRTINRIAGNVAANTDRNRHIIQEEFSVSERILLTPGITQLDVSGRFLVQDFPNGAADLPIFVTLVDSNGTPLVVTATATRYNDDAAGWIDVHNFSGDVVVVDTNAVVSMTAYSVTATSSLANVRAGDLCELAGGVNAGTYIVDLVTGNEVELRALDGEPIVQASGQSGFDKSALPTSCKIIGSGRFLTNPRVTFSAAIPAGTNYVLLGRSTRIGDDVFSLPGVESTFPEYAGGGGGGGTLQIAYNGGNTVDLAAATNLTITTPPAAAADFEVVGSSSGFFKVSGNVSGDIETIGAYCEDIVFAATNTVLMQSSSDMSLGSGGLMRLTTSSGLADSTDIEVETGDGFITFGSGDLLLGSGDCSSGTSCSSGSATLRSGGGGGTSGNSGSVDVYSGATDTGSSGDVSVQSGAAGFSGYSGRVDVKTGDSVDGDSGRIALSTGAVSGGSSSQVTGDISLTTGDASAGTAIRDSGTISLTTGPANTGSGHINLYTGDIPSSTPGGASGPISITTGQARGTGYGSGAFEVTIGESYGGAAGDIIFNLGAGAPNSTFYINDPIGGTIASWTTASPATMYLNASLEIERTAQNDNRFILPYTNDVRGVAGALRSDGTTVEFYTGTSWEAMYVGSPPVTDLQTAYETGSTISATPTHGTVDILLDEVYFQTRTSKDERLRLTETGVGELRMEFLGTAINFYASDTIDMLADNDITISSVNGSVNINGAFNIIGGSITDLRGDSNNQLILPSTSPTSPETGAVGYNGTDIEVYSGTEWVTVGGGSNISDMQVTYDNGSTVQMTNADDIVYTLPVSPGAAAFRVEGDDVGHLLIQGTTGGGIDRFEAMGNWFNLEAYESNGFQMRTSARTTGVLSTGEFRLSSGQITGTATGSSGSLVLESGNVIGGGDSGVIRVQTGNTDTGNVGSISLITGDVGAGGVTGGDIVLETGTSEDSSTGDIVFTIGNSVTDDTGNIEFNLGTAGPTKTVGSFVVNDPTGIPIVEFGMGSPFRRAHMRGSIEFDRVIATVPNDYRFVLPYTEDARGVEGALRYSATGLEYHDGVVWTLVGGGGGSAALQSAYDNGNTILAAAARPVQVTTGGAGTGTVFDCGGSDNIAFTSATGNELQMFARVTKVDLGAAGDGATIFTAVAGGSDDSGPVDIYSGDTLNGDVGDVSIYAGESSGSGTDGTLSLGTSSKQDALVFVPGVATLDVPMTVTDTGGGIAFTRDVGGDGSFVLPQASTATVEGGLRYNGANLQVYDGGWNNVGGAGASSLQQAYDNGNTIVLSAASMDLTITLDTLSATAPLLITGVSTKFNLTANATGDLNAHDELVDGPIKLATYSPPTGNSGFLNLTTGTVVSTNTSGSMSLTTGDTVGGAAGGISISAGDATGAGAGGNVSIEAGDSSSGVPGDVKLESSGFVQIIDGSAVPTDTGYRRGSWEIQKYDYAADVGVTAGDAVYLIYDATDVRMEVAPASAVTATGEFLGIALESATSGNPVYVIMAGKDIPIRTNEAWVAADLGTPCFLSPVHVGRLVKTAPVTPGQWITRIGFISVIGGTPSITLKSFEPKEII